MIELEQPERISHKTWDLINYWQRMIEIKHLHIKINSERPLTDKVMNLITRQMKDVEFYERQVFKLMIKDVDNVK